VDDSLCCAGEVLLGDLSRAGFDITSDHEAADAIVVNTCAFVEDAKSESLEVRGAPAGACWCRAQLQQQCFYCIV
jgi:hypothetical protein